MILRKDSLGSVPGTDSFLRSVPHADDRLGVANAINTFFNNGGTLPPGFAGVLNLTGTSLANALTQLDGENAAGAEHSAFQLMNEFLNLMLDPYVYGRGGFGPAANCSALRRINRTACRPTSRSPMRAC
jgi:hypothetical protein